MSDPARFTSEGGIRVCIHDCLTMFDIRVRISKMLSSSRRSAITVCLSTRVRRLRNFLTIQGRTILEYWSISDDGSRFGLGLNTGEAIDMKVCFYTLGKTNRILNTDFLCLCKCLAITEDIISRWLIFCLNCNQEYYIKSNNINNIDYSSRVGEKIKSIASLTITIGRQNIKRSINLIEKVKYQT